MKNLKKTLTLVLAAAVTATTVFAVSPAEAQATNKTASVTLTTKGATKTATISKPKDKLTITPSVKKVTIKKANLSVKSSKTSVATVKKSGKKVVVTGVKAGKAKITITYKNKVKKKTTTYKATYTVTVKQPTTSVKLNKTSASLKVKGTVSLTATVKPSNTTDTFSWKTSNSSVASIKKNGKKVTVTAKKAGTATITATSGSKKATCKITVNTVTLDKKTASLEVGQTVTLKATVKPSGKATFTSSDTSVATVDKSTGKVKAVKVGTAKITATYGKATATCTVTVKEATPAATPYSASFSTAGYTAKHSDGNIAITSDEVQADITALKGATAQSILEGSILSKTALFTKVVANKKALKAAQDAGLVSGTSLNLGLTVAITSTSQSGGNEIVNYTLTTGGKSYKRVATISSDRSSIVVTDGTNEKLSFKKSGSTYVLSINDEALNSLVSKLGVVSFQ